MMPELIIRPEAEAELEEAYKWYEKQRAGLGHDLLLCVEEGLIKIQRSPLLYPVIHKNLRRLLIRRFPYGIFYAVRENIIVVVAVFHARRDPKKWKLRN